ncbi:MAG: hypothetical protein ABL995_17655 [Bryobacteraceae bacterium]
MRGIKRLVFLAAATALTAALSHAQVNVSGAAPVKNQASSSTGAAVPTTANYTGANSSGNLTGIVACDSSALLTVSTATTTQTIALSAGKSIYVCAMVINGGGTTTAKLVTGTGTNCGTGQSNLTPTFNLVAGSAVSLGNGLGVLFKTASGGALCVTNSAAQAANVFVVYTQF